MILIYKYYSTVLFLSKNDYSILESFKNEFFWVESIWQSFKFLGFTEDFL